MLEHLYTRRINSPEQVLKLLHFPHMDDNDRLPNPHNDPESDELPYDGIGLRLLADRFMLHFTRYLYGFGHPDTAGYNDLIAPDVYAAARREKAFRTRQFMSLMSGTTFLNAVPRNIEVSSYTMLVEHVHAEGFCFRSVLCGVCGKTT
jgi:hypothetical protein